LLESEDGGEEVARRVGAGVEHRAVPCLGTQAPPCPVPRPWCAVAGSHAPVTKRPSWWPGHAGGVV